MKIKHIVYIFFLFIFSCTQQEETDYQLPNPQPKVVKANGYIVPKDSMAAPKVIKIDKSKLKVVKAGKPKVVATNTNIHKAGKPKIVKAGTPRIIKIGSDTFPLPKKVKATGKVVPCKMPKPVQAAMPVMKDNATCNIQYLDVDQGMNSSNVRCMLEDKTGNLWFGTNGGGVSKYDGESFTHFTTKEGLSKNYVKSIIEDKIGNLWFGTGGGVSKYDGASFTHFTEKEGLSNNNVLCIIEDKYGNLWFGTNGGGVSKYDGASFTHFTEKEGLSNNAVLSIFEDRKGRLWFGTDGGGVCKYDGASFTHFTEKEGLSNNAVLSIIEDKNGNLLFGTDGGGISKYDGASFTHFTEKEGLSNKSVKSILEDKTGNLWFGTYGGGVNKYDPTSGGLTHFTEKEGLSNNYVRSIIKDKTGNLWFATDGGGVSKFEVASFVHFTEKEGLSINNVWSIVEDKTGNLWFGTSSIGVCKYDGASFTHFTEKEGLSSNYVSSIIEDKTGNLWFGTYGGVSKYQPSLKEGQVGTFTHFTEKEGLINNFVYCILEDKTGNLWFGTEGGVSKYDGASFSHFTEKEGLSNNNVLSITEDKMGNLWFGTNGGGVSKYDPVSGGFIHFTEKEGLSNNTVLSIIEDKTGKLWFGTYGGGVSKYDPASGVFTHFTEKEGLSNNYVLTIIEVPFEPLTKTNLYFATEKGLSNFVAGNPCEPATKLAAKPAESNTLKWVIIKKRDGLKAENFYHNAALIDSKGNGWWGSGKALSRLNIKDYKFPDTAPIMQINGLEINENFIDYRSLTDTIKDSLKIEGIGNIRFTGVAAFNNYPKELELPYNLNHLTFSFSAIDWAAPHKIQYQYMLKGLDKNWSELTSESKADYRNIPFGKFTFKVRAIGVAGKWSNTFEYSFVIHPPWWRTWWAYGLYLFVIIAAIAYYIKWREKALKQRQVELEQTVDERTAEVIQEKQIVEVQKHLVEEKNKEILDSIEYAKRIQNTILPPLRIVKKYLQDSFILYLPKDIVAGDFYWMENIEKDSNVYFAACDSTGHGVPGAMVSVVCHNALNKALKEFGKRTPSEILDKVSELVIEDFNKNAEDNDEIKDGMDASLCALDTETGILQWAGANNPLWLIRHAGQAELDLASSNVGKIAGQARNDVGAARSDVGGGNDECVLYETKADKQPVGGSDERHPYTNHTFQLQKGDVIYLITDGYADQFGGEKNRKFQKAKLKELLIALHQLPMEKQRNKLYETFTLWRGTNEQVDDVCIIGVRI